MNALLRLLVFVLLSYLPLKRAHSPQSEPTSTPSPAAILSPAAGEALQGNISITGRTSAPGFQSAELTFAYSHNPTDSWFLIWESREPIADGLLAHWDTTTLTDGEYTLRLVVILEDGSQPSTTVPDLRVRNYTPIETNTPTPVTPTATLKPGDTPIPTLTPTPTQTPIPPTATLLPPNPARLTLSEIAQGFGKGALVVIGLFALLGVYQIIKGMS